MLPFAREKPTVSRRSLTSFRRKLALSPEVQQPKWARPDEARALLPAMLAGTWNSAADTLALMGARGAALLSAGISAPDWAARIVRRLLKNANADWRVWASLSCLLPLLAEAAPSEFISAVEDGISGEDPPLLKLFAD